MSKLNRYLGLFFLFYRIFKTNSSSMVKDTFRGVLNKVLDQTIYVLLLFMFSVYCYT